MKVVKKLLLKIGHYRYIVNLRPLIKAIAKYTDYNYILDLVDLFLDAFLNLKKVKKVLKK